MAKSLESMKLVLFQLAFGGVIVQCLPCHTANRDNCPSVLCPNTVVYFTYTIPSGTAAGLTDWVLPTGTCPTNPFPDKIRLSQYISQLCSASGEDKADTCGPNRAYSIQSSDPTYCLSSILTVNITSAMNGSTLTCCNTDIKNSLFTVVSSATINVVAPPVVPTLMIKPIGPDSLLVTVDSSSSGGRPTSYNVTISNSNYINTKSIATVSNGSTMVTFTGLTNGSYYNVSVVAINCAGSSNATTQQVILISSSTNPALLNHSHSEEDTARSVTIAGTVIGCMIVVIGCAIGGVVIFIHEQNKQLGPKAAQEAKNLDGLSSTPKVSPSLEESSLSLRAHSVNIPYKETVESQEKDGNFYAHVPAQRRQMDMVPPAEDI